MTGRWQRTGAKLAGLVLCAVLNGANLAAARPASLPASGDQSPDRPNVVIILADDAGYGDFGFQGSREIATPNIDALARQGVVFDQAYASMPFCSPSRAGLLTGRYTQRFGYEFNLTQAAPTGVDPRYMGLDIGQRTIGDYFRSAGYRTIAVGKWHLGTQPQFHPNVRGFTDFYGFLGGSSHYATEDIAPGTIERNGQPAVPVAYLTDDFAREAAAYVTANKDRPFLLYLAFNAVHTPMEARSEDLARVATIADPQRRRLAAMTLALDRAVGTLTATLRKLKLDRRTLVVFTNDNGGDRVGLGASNAPLRGTKGTLLEGGIRVPLIVRYPDCHDAGMHSSAPVSLLDVLPTALAEAKLPRPEGLDGRELPHPGPGTGSRTLFWRYDNMAAVREGRWKLLRFPDRPPQLYDISADTGETQDRAPEQPALVRSLMTELFAWEGTVEHPRWHTGTYWSQEDVRRYDGNHVAAENAKEKRNLEQHPEH